MHFKILRNIYKWFVEDFKNKFLKYLSVLWLWYITSIMSESPLVETQKCIDKIIATIGNLVTKW